MKTMNRAALLVQPREPYLRWAAGIDEQAPQLVRALERRTAVYLIPEDEVMDEDEPRIIDCYREIFETELQAWSLDEDTWPEVRDLPTFEEWFEVRAQSIVVDLGLEPIEIEESDF